MAIKKLLLLVTLGLGVLAPLLAQEDILKKHVSGISETTFCLYPSTIRMINLQRNPALDEFANTVEKLLIFRLQPDSSGQGTMANKNLIADYQDEGFEEYATMYGGGNNMMIYGKDGSTNQLIGYYSDRNQTFAFFLRGNIAWQKIPTMFQTLDGEGVFNFLTLNPNEWD